MPVKLFVASLIATLALAACSAGDQPPIQVSDIDLTPAIPGRNMSAGYLTLTNNSDDAIVVTRVASNAYRRIELHETTLNDGVARMRPVNALTVPARESVRMERGGLHLMLMGRIDDVADVTLSFYDGDALLLTVTEGQR